MENSGATARTVGELFMQVREVARLKHLSYRTEQTYLHWIKRFIAFHGKRHPKNLGAPEIRAFLSHLALHGEVTASTQNVAFSALLFMYREILGVESIDLEGTLRARRPQRLPVVLTRQEITGLLAQLQEPFHLMAGLLYGSGLRLMECVRLRVKDIDVGSGQITVRQGKGNRDRVTVLPQSLAEPLSRQLEHSRAFYENDRTNCVAPVLLPGALERKYHGAGCE